MTFPGPVRALAHRNFQLFFTGQLISLIGTWMQNVAQAWLVYRLTGSTVLLGAVSFAQQFPVLLLSPLGGTVADRHNRHRLVIATQTSALILSSIFAALVLTGTIRVWHIFVLAILFGSANAFDIAARQALIPNLVGKPDLMNAIALNSSILNLSRIAGPAIAGVLVAAVGEGWCILGNAVSFLAVIAGLLLMRVPPQPSLKTAHPHLDKIREGFRFLLRHEALYLPLALLGVMNLMGVALTTLMPVFAGSILKGGPEALGTLMCMIGAGALLAAIFLTLRTSLKGLGSWMAVSAVIFGVCAIAFSASRNYRLSLLLAVGAGFGTMTIFAGSLTVIQSLVPDVMRGRAVSAHAMMVSGMSSIGALLAGLAAGRWGAPVTVALGAAMCLIAGAAYWKRLPALRLE